MEKNAFFRGFEKKAWMDVPDIEKSQGNYEIPPFSGHTIRNWLDKERGESFALKHPILSGIPTLGVWPTLAHRNAIKRVKEKIYKNDPEYAGAVSKLQKEHGPDTSWDPDVNKVRSVLNNPDNLNDAWYNALNEHFSGGGELIVKEMIYKNSKGGKRRQ